MAVAVVVELPPPVSETEMVNETKELNISWEIVVEEALL